MHLMYYLGVDGKRVYTLKVRMRSLCDCCAVRLDANAANLYYYFKC